MLAEYADFFALNARLFAVFIQEIILYVYSGDTQFRAGSAPSTGAATVAQRCAAHAPA